jgi:hypothetical protein
VRHFSRIVAIEPLRRPSCAPFLEDRGQRQPAPALRGGARPTPSRSPSHHVRLAPLAASLGSPRGMRGGASPAPSRSPSHHVRLALSAAAPGSPKGLRGGASPAPSRSPSHHVRFALRRQLRQTATWASADGNQASKCPRPVVSSPAGGGSPCARKPHGQQSKGYADCCKTRDSAEGGTHARRVPRIARSRMPTRSTHSRTVRARSPAVFWPLILRGHATARLLAHTCSHKAAMS